MENKINLNESIIEKGEDVMNLEQEKENIIEELEDDDVVVLEEAEAELSNEENNREEVIDKPTILAADTNDNSKVQRPESKVIRMDFGVVSNEILKDKEEKNAKTFEQLLNYKRANTLLWVKLDHAEINSKHTEITAICKWNDLSIMVPESKFFMPSMVFSSNYENLTNDVEKTDIRFRQLGYQIGAKICIMIDDLRNYKDKQGNTVYEVIGNRVRAMNLLKFYYFTRDNIEEENKINVGDVVKANVLSVSPMQVIVECLGVETRLDRYDISKTRVQDCRKVVKVGDELLTRIQRLHINIDEKTGYKDVYLSLNARIRNVEDIRDALKVDSVYQGTVTRINEEKGIYTVTLPGNINVSCYKTKNNYNVIHVGDKVTVITSKVTENYAFGRIINVVSTF